MRRLTDFCFYGLCVAYVVASLAFYGLLVHRELTREKPAAFVADGNDVTLIAITDEGTRVYRVFGPKMLYATVIVVGPDGRASIRQ